MAILEISGIHKKFGNLEVLKGIDFTMEQGEVLAVIGSSGGGKTTLLRCLTFLERCDRGSLKINGEPIFAEEEYEARVRTAAKVYDVLEAHEETRYKKCLGGKRSYRLSRVQVPKGYRPSMLTETRLRTAYPKEEELRIKGLQMGLVFQDFNLFPHMSVLDNLMLAPQLVQKFSRDQAKEVAVNMLQKVGLSDKQAAYPCQLSGGQKQRVAIARALCLNPSILCFDEPTSALDPELTIEVLKVISSLKEQGVTMLIVTHEIAFAREIADNVIFLDQGVILERGNAKELIDHPKSDRAKEFLQKIMK